MKRAWAAIGLILCAAAARAGFFGSGSTAQSLNQNLRTSGYNIVGSATDGCFFGEGLAYAQGYVYKLCSDDSPSNRFVIWDVHNPASPSRKYIGGASLFNQPTEIEVRWPYAYILGGLTGTNFAVMDVSIASAPALVTSIVSAPDSGGVDLALQGNYAYCVYGALIATNTFRVVDISSPTNPRVIGGTALSLPTSPNGIVVRGKYAYITFENGNPNSFRVVDISDPKNPRMLTAPGAAIQSEPREPDINGHYVYGASWFENTGLQVIDVSNPHNAAQVKIFPMPNSAVDVHVVGRFAFVGMDDNVVANDSLRIVDITDPLNPRFVTTASWNKVTQVHDITSYGKYVYISGRQAGASLFILEMDDIDATAVTAGNMDAQRLAVRNHAEFENDANIEGGLNVGAQGVQSRGPVSGTGFAVSGTDGMEWTAEALMGISTPTRMNILKLSTNNGFVYSTGTTTCMQWRRLDGAAKASD